MQTRKIRILTSFLAVVILSNSLFFAFPQKSLAQTSADGGAQEIAAKCGLTNATTWIAGKLSAVVTGATPNTQVSVKNDEAASTSLWDGAKECLLALWNALIKIAFNMFKKRLLDRLTDDLVGWISGKTGKPKFITNYKDMLKNTADAALGDTIRAIGAGKLCDNKLSVQLQLNLQALDSQDFSKRVDCTLSQVVKNIGAFGDNFKNGSWIGYQEVNSLQNNKYGLQLLAMDNLARGQAKQTDLLKTEMGGSNGFLSTKLCNKWTIIGQKNDCNTGRGTLCPAEIELGSFISPRGNDTYLDAEQDGSALAIKFQGDSSMSSSLAQVPPNAQINKLLCKPEDQKITTPGSTLAASLSNSLDADTRKLIGADDLTPYLAKIFDAAFNRVIKEGVRGLAEASTNIFSQSSTGTQPQSYQTSSQCSSIRTNGTTQCSLILTQGAPQCIAEKKLGATDADYAKCNLAAKNDCNAAAASACDRDAIYVGYGGSMVSTATSDLQLNSVSTSTIYNLASTTLNTINTKIPPILAEVQALYVQYQGSLMLLSSCEKAKTLPKEVCPTTSLLLTQLIPVSSRINGVPMAVTTYKNELLEIIGKLNNPSLKAADASYLSVRVQLISTDITDTIDKFTSDKSMLTAINLTEEYNSCSAAIPSANKYYICPGTSTPGGGPIQP